MAWVTRFVGEGSLRRPEWYNDDPTDKWWVCRECGADKINLRSGDGCVCPNGHGGITPGLVTEEKRAPVPRDSKFKHDVSVVIAGLFPCAAARGCKEETVISIGGKAHCWGCALKKNVDPRSVLGPDWREQPKAGGERR